MKTIYVPGRHGESMEIIDDGEGCCCCIGCLVVAFLILVVTGGVFALIT